VRGCYLPAASEAVLGDPIRYLKLHGHGEDSVHEPKGCGPQGHSQSNAGCHLNSDSDSDSDSNSGPDLDFNAHLESHVDSRYGAIQDNCDTADCYDDLLV